MSVQWLAETTLSGVMTYPFARLPVCLIAEGAFSITLRLDGDSAGLTTLGCELTCWNDLLAYLSPPSALGVPSGQKTVIAHLGAPLMAQCRVHSLAQ